MESQQFEYWLPPNHHDAYAHHPTAFYDFTTPDLASIPSLSGSPTSTTFDGPPALPPNAALYHHSHATSPYGLTNAELNLSYQLPVTPSDFGSEPSCSPRPPPTELAYSLANGDTGYPLHIAAEQAQTASHSHSPYHAAQPERTHTTSGRRRAQNRAAQRAFRERKEKHARDLETQLAQLTEKYGKLEASHAELGQAYEKLRKTIELLTGGRGDVDVVLNGEVLKREDLSIAARDPKTLRKLLEILHGEVSGKVKMES